MATATKDAVLGSPSTSRARSRSSSPATPRTSASTSASSSRASAWSRTGSPPWPAATAAGSGPSRSRACRAAASRRCARPSCCPATTRSSAPSGCRGPSGCARATSAPATCCRSAPTTRASSPAGRRRATPSSTRSRSTSSRWPASACCRRRAATRPPSAGSAARTARRAPARSRRAPRARRAGSSSRCRARSGTVFGVCANEWSPDDGKVVSLDHGCGAHSETGNEPVPTEWPESAPLIDELRIDVIPALSTLPRAEPRRRAVEPRTRRRRRGRRRRAGRRGRARRRRRGRCRAGDEPCRRRAGCRRARLPTTTARRRAPTDRADARRRRRAAGRPGAVTVDPFGTAALRAAVLGAWKASPARLREDANVEEDHARGYYRDRVVVELAQNAADAAVRAGVPGRLLLRLARTGRRHDARRRQHRRPARRRRRRVARLDARVGEARRRARGAVGRFGVGFAAVRAVADEVGVLLHDRRRPLQPPRHGGAARRRRVADGARRCADEVRRRDGSLPALRLPLPDRRPPADGLRHRGGARAARRGRAPTRSAPCSPRSTTRCCSRCPGLVEIVVEDGDEPPRRLADVERALDGRVRRGRAAARAARRPPGRGAVRARVARHVGGARAARPGRRAGRGGRGPVVHAPDPDRRPARPARAARRDPPARPDAPPRRARPLDRRGARPRGRRVRRASPARSPTPAATRSTLVPTGLAAGPLDAALRPRLVAAPRAHARCSPRRPIPAAGCPRAMAVAVAGPVQPAALAALGRRVAGLVVAARRAARRQARALGVDVRTLADLVEELPAAEPGEWPELYEALASLAQDGPTAGGARARCRCRSSTAGSCAAHAGPCSSTGEVDADALAVVGGLGRAHRRPRGRAPAARAGRRASPWTRSALLRRPEVRRAALDEPDDDGTVATVLALAAAAGRLPDDVRAWTGLLELEAADGEPTPADGLVLPGSPAADLLDDRVMAPVSRATCSTGGARTSLVAVGVRRDLVVVTVEDVLADAASLGDGDDPAALQAQSLDGWEDYLEHLGARARRRAPTWVRWPRSPTSTRWPTGAGPTCSRGSRGDPELRRALLEPVRAETGRCGAVVHGVVAARARATSTCASRSSSAASADALVRAAPAVVRGPRRRGAARARRRSAARASSTARTWSRVLARWADGIGEVDVRRRDRRVAVGGARRAARRSCRRSSDRGRIEVVAAAEVAVADSPMWWQRTDVAAMVPRSDVERARRGVRPAAGVRARGRGSSTTAGTTVGRAGRGARRCCPTRPGRGPSTTT